MEITNKANSEEQDATPKSSSGSSCSQLDDAVSQLVAVAPVLGPECLGLPIILRRVLDQLTNKELIDLSLVNKLWNYEARSVLKDRSCLRAAIDSGPVCRGLVDLASDLQQMRVVPFTGIRVNIDHSADKRDTCQPAPVGSLDPSYQVILDRLPFKHLSFRLPHEWRDSKDCPAVVLVTRILEDHCGTLEELTMDYLDSKEVEFIHNIIQARSFPCLKTLKLSLHVSLNTLPTALAKALVSSAPNLERFYFFLPTISEENFMEGSSAVLVVDGLNPLYIQVCDSLIGAIRTELIFVQSFGSFDVELLNRFVPMVMEASRTTLKTLYMDLLFALPLMCYGICLENVTELFINMTDTIVGTIRPDILAIVKAFDFTRVFPRLSKVTICDPQDPGAISDDEISVFVERGNGMLREALPDGAINIKHLDLDDISFGRSTALLLADMFPHVTKLSVATRTGLEFPCTLLWEHFGRLAELLVEFRSFSSPETVNWDSSFCGIFHEEVAELRAKDDEYLEAVNIVPVMPSITCMKSLRLFTLKYQPGDCKNRKNPTRMFSKVTGLIGFLRCPTLSVTFQTPSHVPAVLEHMRPYVTLVTDL